MYSDVDTLTLDFSWFIDLFKVLHPTQHRIETASIFCWFLPSANELLYDQKTLESIQ